MEPTKGQKRPFNLKCVLNDSQQLSTWDSDSEEGGTPDKRPRPSHNNSDEDTHVGRNQDSGEVAGSQQTLQYHNSDVSGHGDLSTAEKGSVNGKDDTKKFEVLPGSSGNKISDNADKTLNGDADGSQDTVVMSEEDSEGVKETDESMARSVMVERDSHLNTISQIEGGTVSSGELWKSTSLQKDVGIITGIIPDAKLTSVIDSLTKHRANPDRLNIVMAAVLDTASAASITPQNEQAQVTGLIHSNEDQTASTKHTHEAQTEDRCKPLEAQGAEERDTSDNSTPGTSHCDSNRNIVVKNGVTEEKERAVSEGSGNASSDTNGQRAQQGSSEGETSIYKDVRTVIVKVKGTNPEAGVSATEVYMLLTQEADQVRRVDLVCNALLKKYGVGSTQNHVPSNDDIFNQAMKLNSEFPHIDPSVIYELLEKEENQKTGFQSVREKLQRQTSSKAARSTSSDSTANPPLSKDDSVSNDPLVQNDAVFRDMRIISKMFPERDQNELYALVEAHYYKKDRVQVVIEELLQQENSQGNTQTPPQPQEIKEAVVTATPNSDVADFLLQAEVDHLRDIFPDCDPNYILERLELYKSNPDRIKVIASEMFERKNYPLLKDVQEKQTKAARKRQLQNINFTTEEFLAKFPDPSTVFSSTNKEMREGYRNHVDIQLKHDFPDFRHSYVSSVVQKHHHHLMPIVRELEAMRANILANGGRSKKLRDVPKEMPLSYPEEPDEYFFYELWYTMNEQKVREHFDQKAALRQVRVEEARTQNELYECQCCFEDECLFEDMNTCADGHLFCRECIARSVEAAFGEGKTVFPCLTGTCEHQIPLSVLKQVLPSSMFCKVLRKLQEEEVRQAGIADLVECPFCPFATIMDNPDDHVFRCLNPECLKDSCRLCREPNHVPLKCEEVEKQTETDMRTFIEKRVTEAMLRKCHHCGKHFVKDVGCNKMTCVCGATSCYVCREPDIGYDHFGQNCSEQDMNKLHREEMERAAREAKEEYLRLHPEAASLQLKHDPTHHIPPPTHHHHHHHHHGRRWRPGQRRRKRRRDQR
ncbi:uncharacterized protein LOC143281024 isoform X2 [Babylonia areolata]|uniref:uncharacterized protein LOC143281024 isoform X2 n=1 Tax=Babylonia areolata TaxID=304850 RepID=UPI003FD15B40